MADSSSQARAAHNAQDMDKTPIAERVNARSLRPNSPAFRHFMTQGWGPEDLHVSPLESSHYISARLKKLSEAFPGERLIIPAGMAKVRNNDCDYAYRPDTTFAYYTGLGEDYEQGAVLVLEPSESGTGHTPLLFLHPRDDWHTPEFFRSAHYGEYWVGARPGLKEFHTMTGLETRPISELTQLLSTHVSSEPGGVKLRIIKEADPRLTRMVENIREFNGFTNHIANEQSDDELHQFAAEARMYKDEYEVKQIRTAIETTRRGFDNMLRHLDTAIGKPRGERILEGAFNMVCRYEGNALGYDTIVASGDDAPTLHWMRNTHTIGANDVLLSDAGAESLGLYSADITRTFPVNGHWTKTQRMLYTAVYKAQLAGFEAVQLGNTYSDIHHAVMRSLATDLHDWGVLPVSVEESLRPEGQYHRRWHACGCSHHLGIDVHDCAEARFSRYQGGKFAPGMVFTIEPGLYFRANDELVPPEFRGIGIRIEDDVLVTKDGARWMSKDIIPSAPDDVEKWVQEQRAHAGEEVL
jgi:Xaa-Pro aminopeptidase